LAEKPSPKQPKIAVFAGYGPSFDTLLTIRSWHYNAEQVFTNLGQNVKNGKSAIEGRSGEAEAAPTVEK